MRVGLLLVLFAGISFLPYALGARVLAAGPRYLVGLSLVTLAGIASGGVLLIAAAIDPSSLSAKDIPEAVGHCVDEAGRILAHPIQHWPRIIAALILLLCLVRLGISAVATAREVRRSRLPRRSLPGEDDVNRRLLGASFADIRVVSHPVPIAYTNGLFRGQIVVSTAMLEGLLPDEVQALIAHERAHVQGRHTGLMFVGRVLTRAFGFLPPVQRAAQQLLLGLEAAADDRAVQVVGSPAVVARALTVVAERTISQPLPSGLGAAISDVVLRIRRLALQSSPAAPVGVKRGQIAVTFAIVLVLAQVGALSVIAANGASGTRALHKLCHLPHTTPLRG